MQPSYEKDKKNLYLIEGKMNRERLKGVNERSDIEFISPIFFFGSSEATRKLYLMSDRTMKFKTLVSCQKLTPHAANQGF